MMSAERPTVDGSHAQLLKEQSDCMQMCKKQYPAVLMLSQDKLMTLQHNLPDDPPGWCSMPTGCQVSMQYCYCYCY